MRGITRGIQRRTSRLEKAQTECELQRQSLEQARQLLQTKEEAVAAADSDLCFLREVHADLARRYTVLTETSAMQGREAKQKELQQSQHLSAKQVIWKAATEIRGLGADPRIEAALFAMESLFNELTAATPVQQQASAANLPSHVQPLPPVQTVAPAISPPAAAAPIICQKCWSVACHCRTHIDGINTSPITDIEVDLERGKKRSCVEAELPGRLAGAQQSPQALLVDSCGLPTKSDVTEEQVQEPAPCEGMATSGKATDECKPESMQVESAPVAAVSAASDSKLAAQPVPAATVADDESVIEVSGKQESRSSFAALVKATCSQRACPY